MFIEQLLKSLNSDTEINGALEFLEDIIVDRDQRIAEAVSNAIKNPTLINDINRFASLLVDMNDEAFIPLLIQCVRNADLKSSKWLADYMYALGDLLQEHDEYWVADDYFVNLLGNWLLSTDGGEISWKAAIILAELKNPLTQQYYLRGAMDKSLFHQTRIACVSGLVNQYPNEAIKVVEELLNDSNEHVRDDAEDAYRWLKEKSTTVSLEKN